MEPVGPWSAAGVADGVITLPDHTQLRGRGLRRPVPTGALPTFGLYATAHEPPPMPWTTRWIVWPDFRLPRDRADALDAFIEAHRRAADDRVEIACGGGRGRTGTAMACIAVLAGVPPPEAVEFVRARYDRHAVETPWQRRFVQHFQDGP